MKAAIVYNRDLEKCTLDNQDTIIQMQEISAILNKMNIETQSFCLENSFDHLQELLCEMNPDFIFNLVEAFGGTDRLYYLAAGFFDYLKIPYTGCGAVSLALLSSKIKQKQLMRLANLPTADFITDQENITAEDGFWIVKSDSEHASVGINSDSIVKNLSEAKNKIIKNSKDLKGVWFAERYIEGREFNISMLDDGYGRPQILPPAEILFVGYPENVPKIVDYAAKWESDSFGYNATPRTFDFKESDRNLLEMIETLCRKCWDVFGLRGAARVDFRVDNEENPWILEVNPNPCLSSDAGFMAAAEKGNLSPSDVIKRLIQPCTKVSVE